MTYNAKPTQWSELGFAKVSILCRLSCFKVLPGNVMVWYHMFVVFYSESSACGR